MKNNEMLNKKIGPNQALDDDLVAKVSGGLTESGASSQLNNDEEYAPDDPGHSDTPTPPWAH